MAGIERLVDRRKVIISGAVALGTTSIARSAFARQDASPEASPEASPVGGAPEGGGMPPLPEGATLVADGLWNPGDLAFGDDGTLYIAETGVAGGADSGDGPPPAATPNAEGTPPAGAAPLVPPQISALAPDGSQTVLTTETGGVGIGFYDGSVYVSNGGSSVGSGFTPLPAENTLSAVDVATGEVRLVAELGPYEVANNPDGLDINPNLYGLAISADGIVFVADAGGNTIYQVDAATGEFTVFAIVPNLTDLTGATPSAEEQAMQPGPRQPVPTGVVLDEGGFVTVTLLSEMWSGPSVLTFAPDATYTVGVSGLSMIVSAALGPDGLLYVSQLTSDFSGEMPGPGAVYRISADGAVEPVAEGLFLPHGIAFDEEGNLFVAVNSIISGPDAPLGQVLRFDAIAPGA